MTKSSAIHLPICAGKPAFLTGAAIAILLAIPVQAQDDALNNQPSIRDVALTPLTDLNLNQDEIPPLLIAAREQPYAHTGVATCPDILRQVADLQAILGDDYDTLAPADDGISVTNIAQRVVGSFIPFRGIIRELSGANERQRDFREAISAGMMRRAYLKGRGEALGCPYPASPATAEVIAQIRAMEEAERDRDVDDRDNSQQDAAAIVVDENGFYSEPVVQQVD